MGKYNGCTIILFSQQSAYDWDHERIMKDGKFKTIKKFNFLDELSKLTQIFIYDRPELVANKAIDDHQYSTIYPPIAELEFESRMGKIHDLLTKTKIEPPYVLVGHSVGAFDAPVFAKKYPYDTKAVFLLDGTRHCQTMLEHTEKRFSDAKNIFFTDKEIQEAIINVIDNPNNMSQNERLEIVLKINNFYGVNGLIKYWNQVPDKLAHHIKIVGLWNIWIINDKEYPNLPIERKYSEQISFLEVMKEYHEKLENQNENHYDAYFFFNRSHDLHHSDAKKIVDIIKKYL